MVSRSVALQLIVSNQHVPEGAQAPALAAGVLPPGRHLPELGSLLAFAVRVLDVGLQVWQHPLIQTRRPLGVGALVLYARLVHRLQTGVRMSGCVVDWGVLSHLDLRHPSDNPDNFLLERYFVHR